MGRKPIMWTNRLNVDDKHHISHYGGAISLVPSKREPNTELNSTSQCVWPIAGVKWFALGGQEISCVDESTGQETSHLALRRCNLLGPNLENTLPTEPPC